MGYPSLPRGSCRYATSALNTIDTDAPDPDPRDNAVKFKTTHVLLRTTQKESSAKPYSMS